MSRRALRAALRLYPRRWRQSKGDELEQLTEDLLDDPDEHPWRVVMSTAVGALREQARPTYLTGGRLVGLGLTGVLMAATGFGLAIVVGQGNGLDLIPASAQSDGHLTSLTGMKSVLEAQRVQVTVDGVTVPLSEIAFRSIGFSGTADTRREMSRQSTQVQVQNARQGSFPALIPVPRFRFSPLVAVKRAIAYQVLTELASNAAGHDGRVVPLSTARAYAEKEDVVWHSHPETLRPGLPKPVFLSASAVASYRQVLTLDKELAVIAGPPGDGDRTPALRRWMSGHLIVNTVVVTGVPGLTTANLPANLPPNL